MANYVGRARSNYFIVKDLDAFTEAMTDLDLKVITSGEYPTKVGLIAETDSGGWPSYRYDADTDDHVDIDMAQVLADHLADGEVAVLEEVGFEKMRYLVGYAVAVNSAGETRQMNLDEIYERAKELGDNVTRASS